MKIDVRILEAISNGLRILGSSYGHIVIRIDGGPHVRPKACLYDQRGVLVESWPGMDPRTELRASPTLDYGGEK